MSDEHEAPIEGSFSVVKVAEPGPEITFQATIRPRVDPKMQNLENTLIVGEKLGKDLAWQALVAYLVKRVNRSEVRQIFEFVLMGGKYTYRREKEKHIFLFTMPTGEFIEEYSVHLLEV